MPNILMAKPTDPEVNEIKRVLPTIDEEYRRSSDEADEDDTLGSTTGWYH